MIRTLARPHRSLIVAAVLLTELVVLAAAYQMLLSFDCQAVEAYGLCRFLRSLVARGLAVIAVTALVVWAMPAVFARFLAAAAHHPQAARWRWVHAAGFALIVVPILLVAGVPPATFFAAAVLPWAIGAALATAGGLLWLAPASAWRGLGPDVWRVLIPAVGLALVVPDLAELAYPLWDIGALTTATFVAVGLVLMAAGQVPFADPSAMVLGLETFAVSIARQCSGVEGFALVLVFSAVYAMLLRATLRQGRFWLVVVPLALLASWAFNVLRIAILIAIGEYISPELAVNGFHSYAGWMFFTALVVAILAVVQRVPGLHHDGAEPVGLPFLRDPVAARIVPFAAFMASGLVAAAFFDPADLGYPLKALAMAAALFAFGAVLAREAWRPDAVAVGSGLAVGLVWALTEPAPGAQAGALAAALAPLGAAALALWTLARVIGTVALVPVVEELFFRGYLLSRLDRGGLVWRLVAVALSSLAFAALHGRFLAALLAGLVFAAVMLRRHRIGDAVWAHVAANLVVAAIAAQAGDWSRL
ncbi:MAG: exosortase E/protease, VPEID-CTERM system [Gemmobacter sp.]